MAPESTDTQSFVSLCLRNGFPSCAVHYHCFLEAIDLALREKYSTTKSTFMNPNVCHTITFLHI